MRYCFGAALSGSITVGHPASGGGRKNCKNQRTNAQQSFGNESFV